MKNQHTEHVDSLRLLLDTRVEDVEERFEAAHLSYLAEAQDKIKRTKELAKRDQEHLKLISKNQRALQPSALAPRARGRRRRAASDRRDCAAFAALPCTRLRNGSRA